MKLTRTTRNAGWLVVAGLLGAALIAPAGAAANGTVWATVTGHVASSPGSPNPNQERYWEAMGYEDCTKIDIHRYLPDGGGPAPDNQEIASYQLAMSYSLVVVKAGEGDYANTLFENASAGEWVFADTNGNNEPDPGGPGGDHNISHIIFCDPVQTTTTTTTTDETTTDETTDETTTTTTTTSSVDTQTTDTTTTTSSVDTVTTTTVTGTIGGDTGKPTPPSTDTVAFSSTSSTTGSGWSLLLVAMAGLLAAALLLTPAVERKR